MAIGIGLHAVAPRVKNAIAGSCKLASRKVVVQIQWRIKA